MLQTMQPAIHGSNSGRTWLSRLTPIADVSRRSFKLSDELSYKGIEGYSHALNETAETLGTPEAQRARRASEDLGTFALIPSQQAGPRPAATGSLHAGVMERTS